MEMQWSGHEDNGIVRRERQSDGMFDRSIGIDWNEDKRRV